MALHRIKHGKVIQHYWMTGSFNTCLLRWTDSSRTNIASLESTVLDDEAQCLCTNVQMPAEATDRGRKKWSFPFLPAKRA